MRSMNSSPNIQVLSIIIYVLTTLVVQVERLVQCWFVCPDSDLLNEVTFDLDI